MLINPVRLYLELRNELGFDLKNDASLLRGFAHFASERGEVHVRTATAIDWASHAPNPAARDRRLKSVIRFARHVHAEDDRHEIPADGVFGHHRQRRLPFIFTPLEGCPPDRDQIGRHMLALSTYMGHAHIADTYWYLQVTPQLLTDIRAAWEAFVKGENR